MNPITVLPGATSIFLGPGIFSITFDPLGAGQTGNYEIHYYDHGVSTQHFISGQIGSKSVHEDELNYKFQFKVKNTGKYSIQFK